MAEMTSSPDILFVDSCRDLADMSVELFRFNGFSARAACSPVEALMAASAQRPDVVFVDVHMPGVNMCAVARALCEVSVSPPYLIALTAWDDAVTLARIVAAGFDRHVRKPFGLQGILSILNERAVTARQCRHRSEG